MKQLASLTFNNNQTYRALELWHGDLTEVTCDILVISAYTNSFYPLPGTLIHALEQKGVSISDLAKNKLEDLRGSHACWLSHPVDGQPFRQILCFEPFSKGKPTDVIGDVFRALVPFVCGEKESFQTVAMPLVSTGAMGWSTTEMLVALFGAAAQWLEHGLPLKKLLLVEKDKLKAVEMKGAFEVLCHYHKMMSSPAPNQPKYDIFISYCQKNKEYADFMVEELHRLKPGIRVFIDRQELQPGEAWQQKLYQSIDDCQKVVTLYTPEYLDSKACLEEYNIARMLHRNRKTKVLYPLYMNTVEKLPEHMRELQYRDVREANRAAISAACVNLVESF
jgi:hypothetical protein